MTKLDSNKLNNKLNQDKSKRQMLIISDLDGTLLDEKGELTKVTINTVKQITSQNHLFCIATGRTPKGSIDIYNQLGLNTVLVNLNGAFIWHPRNPDFIPINIVFSKELVVRLLSNKNIMKNIANVIVESRNGTYVLNKPMKINEIREFKKWFHIDINSNEPYFFGAEELQNMENDPNTILLQVPDSKLINEIIYFLKQTFSTFVVRTWSLPSSGTVIEINTKYANKGNAVDFLESYYGIQKDSTISFGDGENDVELLQKARFSYGMQNGSNIARLVSRFITSKPNYENGVAHELKKIFLNKK